MSNFVRLYDMITYRSIISWVFCLLVFNKNFSLKFTSDITTQLVTQEFYITYEERGARTGQKQIVN